MSVDYDSIASAYDRRYLLNDYSGIEKAVTAFVEPNLDARVLEVGCGTGHWLRSLNGIGEKYQQGITRIRRGIESAEARGDSLDLTADLRLYATFGSVPGNG